MSDFAPAPGAIITKRPSGYVVPDSIHKPLHVITMLSNPLRWKARWKNYERFAQHCTDSGAVLHTVEIAFGERDHALNWASAADEEAYCAYRESMRQQHRWITLQSYEELWHKENAMALGTQRLPLDCEYIAYVDADVHFLRQNWVGETIHKLQHYMAIQMFSHAQDLGPDYSVISNRPSFMHAHMDGSLEQLFQNKQQQQPTYYGYGGSAAGQKPLGAWTGLAWAFRREALDAVGGLMDFCITGAADWYMAWALIGQVERVIPKGSHPNFVKAIMHWQDKALRTLRKDVGVMSGTLAHHFHGRKADRRYVERSKLLATLAFDPYHDIRRDWQGLWQLNDDGTERFVQTRDGIRAWARARNEDATEI